MSKWCQITRTWWFWPILGKVERAELTCEVIKKSCSTFLIKFWLYTVCTMHTYFAFTFFMSLYSIKPCTAIFLEGKACMAFQHCVLSKKKTKRKLLFVLDHSAEEVVLSVLHPSSTHWAKSIFEDSLIRKVQRADLTRDIIKKVDSFVLSKLWILVADWSMHWSHDTFLIKLRLYRKLSNSHQIRLSFFSLF